MLDALLGTWTLIMLIVFVVATFSDMARRIAHWLGSRRHHSVEQTLNQMYGDVHVHQEGEWQRFANYQGTQQLVDHARRKDA